jgi:hypothetical protein
MNMPTTGSVSASASTTEADGGTGEWRPRSPGGRAVGLSAGTIEYQDTIADPTATFRYQGKRTSITSRL